MSSGKVLGPAQTYFFLYTLFQTPSARQDGAVNQGVKTGTRTKAGFLGDSLTPK